MQSTIHRLPYDSFYYYHPAEVYVFQTVKSFVVFGLRCCMHFLEPPYVLHAFPIILTSFGEERNLGISVLQRKNREAEVNICSSV